MELLQLRISKSDAERVLMRPDIFATIAEDGMEVWEIFDGPIYLCGYAPDLIGCFILHQQNKATFECHVQVFPEFREAYAEDFGDMVIEWTWQNTKARKLVAQIPFLYENVKDFALARGFKVEGVNSDSYLKDGELSNQWYLGIKRWDS